MAYLRHLGFPSPLLDWSSSPYVAAFFAFREKFDKVEKRRVYVYCETATNVRGGAVGEPSIHRMGPYVRTHHRHFRQRCHYTICTEYDPKWQEWRYSSHEYVFAHRRPNQDLLWTFDIPSSERPRVLQKLDEYNLNSFSLFGSDESLLESMWTREYLLKRVDDSGNR
jgi:FRG domain